MIHLPFALSTVSFFVRLDGLEKVELTGCALAKIFSTEITSWDNPELVKLNPDLATAGKNVNINVCHRVHGSSSTASITKYLNKKCPSQWSSSKVGTTITWPRDTNSAEGSAGMVACIKQSNGSIGYAESGHGWSEQLTEVSVENADGYYWTAKEAVANDGISRAADEASTPKSAEADWGYVDFINQNGKSTYPMVLMSYVYVRKEIYKYISGQNERGLLKLFLQSLYMDEYYGKCKQLAFFDVPLSVREVALKGINDIDWGFKLGKNHWEFEIDTMKLTGTHDYIISSKRSSYQGVVLEDVTADETKIVSELEELFLAAEDALGYNKFTDNDRQRIGTAIALSAITFTMVAAVLVAFTVKKFLNI